MAGGQNVGFQNSTFLSERSVSFLEAASELTWPRDTADRNNALAYFMRESKCFPNGANNAGGGVDIKNILDFYFQVGWEFAAGTDRPQTCSLEMNCESMSVMAGTLVSGSL